MNSPFLATVIRRTAISTVVLVALLAAAAGTAFAFQQYQTAWQAKYPGSTLPARMAEAPDGSACNVCHHPPDLTTQGNCYRNDIDARLDQGLSIEDALAAVDSVDSDSDGVRNGIEILETRIDQPTQIGYNPGLVGPTGVDPCGASPSTPVTNQLETPPTGACCAGNVCTVGTRDQCEDATGNYVGDGTVCTPNPCPTPAETPTWGKIKALYK